MNYVQAKSKSSGKPEWLTKIELEAKHFPIKGLAVYFLISKNGNVYGYTFAKRGCTEPDGGAGLALNSSKQLVRLKKWGSLTKNQKLALANCPPQIFCTLLIELPQPQFNSLPKSVKKKYYASVKTRVG